MNRVRNSGLFSLFFNMWGVFFRYHYFDLAIRILIVVGSGDIMSLFYI